jgi:hypothetical protein
MMLVADIAISSILDSGSTPESPQKTSFLSINHFSPTATSVKPHFMTTRKSNNTRNNSVKNAKNTLKSVAHTWNQTAKAFTMPINDAQGKACLKAMNVLGVHVKSLATLKAADFFTAWYGCFDKNLGKSYGLIDENNNPMMFKSVAYLVEVGGKDYTLYTLKESGDYSRVSVYEKRTILSETDKNFDKKKHIAPTTDVVVDGLAQCAEYGKWTARVAKAIAKAEALTEGYINCGTAQKPEWTKVIRKDSRWFKALKK